MKYISNMELNTNEPQDSVVCNVSLTRRCSSNAAAHANTISWEVDLATKQETRPV